MKIFDTSEMPSSKMKHQNNDSESLSAFLPFWLKISNVVDENAESEWRSFDGRSFDDELLCFYEALKFYMQVLFGEKLLSLRSI